MRGWIALAVALALSGCGGDGGGAAETKMIDWDLSQSHTVADVDWTKPDLDAVSIKPEGAVRIRLPGGREFRAEAGEIQEIFLAREGDTVKEIQLNGPPASAERAYGVATGWARDWKLPTRTLDDWVEQARSGDYTPNAQTSAPPKDGFEVAVKLLGGYDDSRPGAPAIGFAWLRGAAGGASSGT